MAAGQHSVSLHMCTMLIFREAQISAELLSVPSGKQRANWQVALCIQAVCSSVAHETLPLQGFFCNAVISRFHLHLLMFDNY